MLKVNYSSPEERDLIIEENIKLGYTLIEDHSLLFENYLIFNMNVEQRLNNKIVEMEEVINLLIGGVVNEN